jgi:hypothetical protein
MPDPLSVSVTFHYSIFQFADNFFIFSFEDGAAQAPHHRGTTPHPTQRRTHSMKKLLPVVLFILAVAPAVCLAGDFGVEVCVNETTTIIAPGESKSFTIPKKGSTKLGLQIVDEGVSYGDLGNLMSTGHGVTYVRSGDPDAVFLDDGIIAYRVGTSPYKWWFITIDFGKDKIFQLHVWTQAEVRKYADSLKE